MWRRGTSDVCQSLKAWLDSAHTARGPKRVPHNLLYPTGLQPQLHTWHVDNNGSGLEGHVGALPHAATLDPRTPGRALRPSDALLLQLPEYASREDVQDVVTRVVNDLLPALGYDMARDVQVWRGGWGAWVSWLGPAHRVWSQTVTLHKWRRATAAVHFLGSFTTHQHCSVCRCCLQ